MKSYLFGNKSEHFLSAFWSFSVSLFFSAVKRSSAPIMPAERYLMCYLGVWSPRVNRLPSKYRQSQLLLEWGCGCHDSMFLCQMFRAAFRMEKWRKWAEWQNAELISTGSLTGYFKKLQDSHSSSGDVSMPLPCLIPFFVLYIGFCVGSIFAL